MRPTTANLRYKAQDGIGWLVGRGSERSRHDDAYESAGSFRGRVPSFARRGAGVQSAFVTVARPLPLSDAFVSDDTACGPNDPERKTEGNFSAHRADYELRHKIETAKSLIEALEDSSGKFK